MMKYIIFTGALVLANSMAGESMAACGTNLVTNLKQVIPGNTICQPIVAPVPPSPWTAQEMHIGTTGSSITGNLIDYKLGSSSTIDPTKTLGTYSLSNVGPGACNSGNGGNACNRVTYNYSAFAPPNNTYTFMVYRVSGTVGAAGSVYDFCLTSSGSASATGKLKLGTGAGCP